MVLSSLSNPKYCLLFWCCTEPDCDGAGLGMPSFGPVSVARADWERGRRGNPGRWGRRVICQETFLCHLLRRWVAFVSTHPLRLDVSHFLHLPVQTLVRPLSNKQMTCKLIFCADASFSMNLILWIGIWVASFSSVWSHSVLSFPLSDVPLGFYNLNSSSSSCYHDLRRN